VPSSEPTATVRSEPRARPSHSTTGHRAVFLWLSEGSRAVPSLGQDQGVWLAQERRERVAATARDAGIVTCVGYNHRHVPAVEHARELVADGSPGRITSVRAVFFPGHASEPKGSRASGLPDSAGRDPSIERRN
jgi:hypothetical protein